MPNETGISWCDYTSNPVKYHDASGKDVWACVKVSAGCKHCYAEALALRFDRGKAFTPTNMAGVTPYLDEKELKSLLTSKKIAGKKVFIGDMTDVAGSWVPDDMLDRLFAVFALRPDVVFQVLTKRPERMADYLSSRSRSARFWKDAARQSGYSLEFEGISLVPFPLPNVWIGTSVENQQAADERIPHLLKCPAAVRFLSLEPLLGPVNLAVAHLDGDAPSAGTLRWTGEGVGIDWVVVGGESGPRHRPMEVAWADSLVERCKAAGVPVWVKQDSGKKPGQRGRLSLPVWETKEFPAT